MFKRRTSTHRKSRRASNRKRILLEQLERRELLAADVFQNPIDPLDVNDDAVVSPIDALELINEINQPGSVTGDGNAEGEQGGRRRRFMDVNGDGRLSPLDPLSVINGMRERNQRGNDRGGNNRGGGDGGNGGDNDLPADEQEFASVDGTNTTWPTQSSEVPTNSLNAGSRRTMKTD